MIRTVEFETVLPIWRDRLWPNRQSPIRSISSMSYGGGYDMTIYSSVPVFFAAYRDGEIVGVNSGFPTADGWFRSRGIWVTPEMRGKGISKALMRITEAVARYCGARYLWTIPRQSAMPFYASCGFEQTSDWFDENVEFGPNCYALKLL